MTILYCGCGIARFALLLHATYLEYYRSAFFATAGKTGTRERSQTVSQTASNKIRSVLPAHFLIADAFRQRAATVESTTARQQVLIHSMLPALFNRSVHVLRGIEYWEGVMAYTYSLK